MKFLFKWVLVYFFLNALFINCAQNRNTLAGDGFWTQVNTMRMNQIIWMNDTLYSSRNPLYQSNGGVYRSIDGGINWDTLYSISDVISGGLRLFIHPTNHKILYLIYGALYKSTNAGQSWNFILGSFGPLVRLGINPKNPNIMYVTKSIPYGAVFKTTDEGNTWNNASNGLPSEEYFQAGPIEVNSEHPDTVLLGTNTGLYRSTTGGASWDTTIVKGFITGINIHPSLPQIAFASTLYGFTTFITENFGNNWYSSNDSSGASKFIFNAIYDSIIYSNTNLKSTDRGNNWVKIDSLYNSWTDLGIDNKKNATLYGVSYTYGLFQYTDILATVYNETYMEKGKSINNFPNPFNSTTTIRFGIMGKGNVKLSVHNILGEEIKVLLNEEKEAGYHSIDFNASDLPSGVYFYRIQVYPAASGTGNFIDTKKMILLR
jgi:photosystem II stability/assembly factor-like uncharacterized protein